MVHIIFQRSRAGNTIVNGRMWLEFKLVQDFTPVQFTCKFYDDPTKLKSLSCPQHLHYKYMGKCFDAQGHVHVTVNQIV